MRFHGPSLICHSAWMLLCAGIGAEAADSAKAQPTVTVTVNPSSTHPISPYIYGTNFGYDVDGVPRDLTFHRSGGNRWTAYNWETNASNAGSDYQYQNDNLLSTSKEPAAALTTLIAGDQKKGMATMVTVQLQGLVAGDEDGPVNVADPPDKKRFKKVFYEKKTVTNEPFTIKPSASDDYVYMDEFVWALDHKFSGQNIFGAKPSTQHVFVSLDNEPELWKTTHLEIEGKTGITPDSYIARTVSLATALKKQFPELVIFGPAHYGFMGIYSWNNALGASAGGNNWFTDKYLTALKTASAAFGKPLVDVYDFHWYPEATDSAGARVTTLASAALNDDQVQAIVQSPRSLWDKTYKEKSWITKDVIGQPIDLLGRLQSKIDAENPGMKLALTEYDNGGGQHIAGTLAQADNLGIFGAHNLFAANLWLLSGKAPYTFAGFRAFRDFDGAHHHFGDTSVAANSSNVANVAVYVSTDSARAGRVVMVAINRSTSEQVAAINGQPVTGQAHLFQMSAATAAKQSTVQPVAAGVQPVSGSSVTLTLPAMSVTTADIY
ncbi:MAG TPA: glycoside hydrolase family 44 protein [Steroidobacteraceae bacterium]|nr:glycoside hydrolase family 44 protein [Steroidobacteraceae bacterium]